MPKKFVPFAPDLAVEVVSTNDSAVKVHEKVRDYLRATTRLVWGFYPESKTVAVHTRAGAITLDGGDVLPGFKLSAGDVFPD